MDAPQRVVVIGSGGFIGRHVVREFERHGAQVSGVGRPRPGLSSPAAADVIHELQPQLIVHAAGAGCSDDASVAHVAYVASTAALLHAVALHSPRSRIVVIGSAAELGTTLRRPAVRLHEVELGEPTTAYGRCKREQSTVARELAEQLGLDLVRVRLFNTLGPAQSATLVAGAMVERLRQALADDAEFVVHDSCSMRDFLDVRDVARLLRIVAARVARDPCRPPLNLCSGQGTSVGALAGTLLAAAGAAVRVRFIGDAHDATQCVGEPRTLRQLVLPEDMVAIDVSTSLRDMWQATPTSANEPSERCT